MRRVSTLEKSLIILSAVVLGVLLAVVLIATSSGADNVNLVAQSQQSEYYYNAGVWFYETEITRPATDAEKILNNSKKEVTEKVIFVCGITKDSVADEAGIRKGAVLFAINNQTIFGWSAEKVNEFIQIWGGDPLVLEFRVNDYHNKPLPQTKFSLRKLQADSQEIEIILSFLRWGGSVTSSDVDVSYRSYCVEDKKRKVFTYHYSIENRHNDRDLFLRNDMVDCLLSPYLWWAEESSPYNVNLLKLKAGETLKFSFESRDFPVLSDWVSIGFTSPHPSGIDYFSELNKTFGINSVNFPYKNSYSGHWMSWHVAVPSYWKRSR